MSIATERIRKAQAPGLAPPEGDVFPIAYRHYRRRTLNQRLGLVSPSAFNAIGRAVRTRPIGSRVRRRVFHRAIVDALSAYNRRDWASLLLNVADDAVVNPPADLVALGFEAAYHGHEGFVAYQQRWIAHWGGLEVIPELAIDLGDLLILFGHMGGREPRAGIPVDTEFGTIDSYENSRLTRQRVFLGHAETLAAAGLDATGR